MKGKKHHDFVCKIICIILKHFLSRKFNFEYDEINVNSPYIVISNHLTNWDPLLIGLSFRKNMYYVATDQILRMGWKSKLLNFLFSPIPRSKTTQEVQTVFTIFRRLKENCNICIFAEGITSFNGETSAIQSSTAKLIKKADVTLITYKFKGSYFTLPKWAKNIRKGKMEGRLVQIYPPEKIASMSENEIYEAIKNDIYVNAYAEQEKNRIAFKGKNLAEHLETILYCCPKCRQFAALKSRGDLLTCACGYQVLYNEYGYFEMPNKNEPPIFTTILDWTKWQKKVIKDFAAQYNFDNNTPIFTDKSQILYEIEKTVKRNLIAEGSLVFYKDRFSFVSEHGKTFDFPIKTIIDLSCFSMQVIIFSTTNNHVFEIHCKNPRSVLKYLDLFNAVK